MTPARAVVEVFWAHWNLTEDASNTANDLVERIDAALAELERAVVERYRLWAVKEKRYWSGMKDYRCDDCTRVWPSEAGWPEGDSPDNLRCDVLEIAAALAARGTP